MQLLRSHDLDQLSRLEGVKWSVTLSLLAQLRCNQNDMLDYWGWARFYNQGWSYAIFLQVGDKSLKSFEEWEINKFNFRSFSTISRHLEGNLHMITFDYRTALDL